MRFTFLLVALLLLAACGANEQASSNPSTESESGLSATQLEHGIGPIDQVALGEIDEELADTGEDVFETKCSACHKMETRYVGPALGDVLDRRTPEYVMNMMLNPEEMVQRHPEARAMLAEFLTPMPNQQLTEAEARAVLEYLRDEAD